MLTTFAGTLSCPVATGHIFHIRTKSIDDAERVDIGFQADKSNDADALLHLSIRYEDQRIVRNARLGGQWQQPEQHCDPSSKELQRIKPGNVFTVYILVGDQQFHIAFEGSHVCSFPIKGPLAEMKAITITKDVHQVLCVDHRQSFPFPFPALQIEDSAYYFSNDVPKPFLPGHIIIVTAIPFGNPRGGFILKFNENGSKKQALHFNPRFDPYYVVVRNSHASEALDFRQEERSGGFPFIIDQQFKLAIGLAEQEFKFAINGSKFETYTYKNQRQLDVLNGFRIECTNGLQLEVTAVDHYYSGVPNCSGFEEYSDPNVDIM
ncbi:32 kDa beta-galactoside-binding lectin lec-3-like [Anopheles moucheti]|uniref:32 kDa beta-galactoside-binding lectin lec-3-like n=1 Tax=Anopheles moucheti TaxID=186751 RepID=UPI0022EFE912|nr:32 kDa beta-galactoside-binding lectin lec-3-like [Anopheles moucheti]